MSWFRPNDGQELDNARNVQLPAQKLPAEPLTSSNSHVQSNQRQICKYFAKGECKNGSSCQYKHEKAIEPSKPLEQVSTLTLPSGFKVTIKRSTQPVQSNATMESPSIKPSKDIPIELESLRISEPKKKDPNRTPVSRPKVLSTVEKELGQLKRRWPVGFVELEKTDVLDKVQLQLPPSDPDFPYELDYITLQVKIPSIYPTGPPQIQVIGPETIPLKLRTAIADWYNRMMLAATKSKQSMTLVASFNWLDRHLEQLLIAKPTTTVVTSMVRGDAIKTESSSATDDVPLSPVHADGSGRPGLFEEVEESEESEQSEQSDQDITPQDIQSVSDNLNGTQIRLAGLVMTGVSLLQVSNIFLIVRCTKCRHTASVENLLPDEHIRWIACKTCKTIGGVRLRPQMIHAGHNIIAILDLSNLAAHDLAPSTYTPTCEKCNNPNPGAFKTIQREREDVIFCKSCHQKMTMILSDVRFMVVGGSTLTEAPDKEQLATLSAGLVRKTKAKKDAAEELGIVPGQPLPKNGRCKHYSRSFRWFRFPCCQMIYPCDICHEELKPDKHEMKWANRQICGFCSRETLWDSHGRCGKCGNDLTKPQSKGGFWEGGKGVRDQSRMNRNDPHKFKGLNKTVSKKAAEKKQ